jgi:hypothetical protein
MFYQQPVLLRLSDLSCSMHGDDRYQGNFLTIFASHFFLSMAAA